MLDITLTNSDDLQIKCFLHTPAIVKIYAFMKGCQRFASVSQDQLLHVAFSHFPIPPVILKYNSKTGAITRW